MAGISHSASTGIKWAADIIRNSRAGVVLTGAGISTPSGIPDFRSTNGGLWQLYDPFEVASLTAFRHRPERFFEWMHPLALKLFGAQPNVAHESLARLEQAGYLQTIITQNIDSLHQRAGSGRVIEVHGSLKTMTCIRCYRSYESGDFLKPYLEGNHIPYCPECGGVLKPDLILFEEQLPARAWLAAVEACQRCDVMMVIGSSLEVLPVAGLPMRALEKGAHLILINREPTYIDVRADVVLHEELTEVVPLIVKEVLGE